VACGDGLLDALAADAAGRRENRELHLSLHCQPRIDVMTDKDARSHVTCHEEISGVSEMSILRSSP
jgi:hypothetical protein